MKKYICLVLLANILMAEEYQITKDVIGVNEKNYTETVTGVKNGSTDVRTDNIDLGNGTTKTNGNTNNGKTGNTNSTGKTGTTTNGGITTNNGGNTTNNPLDNYNVEDKTTDSGTGETEKIERDTRIFLGLGGHDKVTNYNYGLIDNSRLKRYDIEYGLLVKRETFEENRENTKTSGDLIQANFGKGKLVLGLMLEKGTQEFPGMTTSPVAGTSDKDFTNFGANASYEIFKDTFIKLDFSNYDNESDDLLDSPYTRDYSYSTYGIKGYKEFLLKDSFGTHSIDAGLGLIGERNSNDSDRNFYYGEVKDRYVFSDESGISADASLKIENYKKTGLDAQIKVSKKMDENVSLIGGIGARNTYKLKKDIISEFTYVNDILDFSNRENERVITLLGGLSYSKDKVYVEANASLNSGDDLLTYESVVSKTGEERSIIVTNYNDQVFWLESDIKASYTLNNNFRSVAKLDLSSLTKIAYTPNVKASLEGIYTKGGYEVTLKGNFNGHMYTNNDSLNRESVDSYTTLDILNQYNFGSDYTVHLNVLNIFDSNGENMKNYPINGRVFSLGFEIKY